MSVAQGAGGQDPQRQGEETQKNPGELGLRLQNHPVLHTTLYHYIVSGGTTCEESRGPPLACLPRRSPLDRPNFTKHRKLTDREHPEDGDPVLMLLFPTGLPVFATRVTSCRDDEPGVPPPTELI